MTIDAQTMGPFEPVYTFVANDGENILIASERLRMWVNEQGTRIEIVLIPCTAEIARKFNADGAISHAHCLKLMSDVQGGKELWPILMGLLGDVSILDMPGQDVICIDGHHTYAINAIAQCPFVPAQFVTRGEWEPFRVVGLPDISRDELRDFPIIKRW